MDERYLHEYIRDPENPETNWNLAIEYLNNDQTASAICFFLRCADRSGDDLDLAYECLIHIGRCFDRQANRLEHVRCMYRHAIALLPKRPEAYYMLANFENWYQNWPQSYHLCRQALELCDFDSPPFRRKCRYPGKWGLVYEKTITCWWWGKLEEYKVGLIDLVTNNSSDMDYERKNIILSRFYEVVIKEINTEVSAIYDKYNKKYGCWGWCSTEKASLLAEYVQEICRRVENPVCVEVGVYGGMSVLPVALSLKKYNKGIIHAIDPWTTEEATKGYEGTIHHDWWTDIDIEKYMNIFLEYIDEYKLHDQVNVIRDASDNVGQIKNIDLLYIDGQHTDQALRDAKKFGSNVTLGGYVLVDDVYWEEESSGGAHSIEYLKNIGFEFVRQVDDAYILKRTSEFDWGPISEEFRNLIDEEIFNKRVYEQHFPVDEGDVVVDVGANCGAFTYSIMDKNPEHVFCIEPSIELVKILDNNLKNYKDKVTIIDRAISSKTSNDALMSADEVFIYNHDLDTYKTVSFKDFVEKFNISKIDFLKTDCEGGEWDIFTEENQDYIRNNVKKIVGEFHICNMENTISKFKTFRDLYLKDVKTLHVYERSGKEITELGEKLSEKIFDDEFLLNYKKYWQEVSPDRGQLVVYVEYADQVKSIEYNTDSIQSGWVVDNFYKDPDEVRSFGLSRDYHIGGIGRGYIGNRTHEQFLFPGLKERFENIMGKKITKWEEHGMNGRFQYCWSGQPQVWHCDSQMWGGMIYLTPDAPYECGTTLYAHKGNRARTFHDEGFDVEWKGTEGDPHLDGTRFEPVDVFGNVYNRLVIFDASCIHSSSGYFGTVKENCRFWQMFFFDAE